MCVTGVRNMHVPQREMMPKGQVISYIHMAWTAARVLMCMCRGDT